MLIVCPNCATSYLIDPASVGTAGRSVRCARCKTTWFASAPTQVNDVSAFVDGVIAEAEAQNGGADTGPPPQETAHGSTLPEADDFGSAPADHHLPEAASGPVGPTAHNHDLAPFDEQAPARLAITDAPPLVPPLEHTSIPPQTGVEIDSEDAESFVARRERLKSRRQTKKRSSRWTAIVLVLFAFNVAMVGARSEVVRHFPQTASLFAAIGLPVNLRNLKFDNVRITKEAADGITALVIEGAIVSTSNKPAEVPRLRFAARNASGQEVYTWTALPGRSILGADETLPFTSRLVSPPADAVDVMVRFFNSQDAIAGTK